MSEACYSSDRVMFGLPRASPDKNLSLSLYAHVSAECGSVSWETEKQTTHGAGSTRRMQADDEGVTGGGIKDMTENEGVRGHVGSRERKTCFHDVPRVVVTLGLASPELWGWSTHLYPQISMFLLKSRDGYDLSLLAQIGFLCMRFWELFSYTWFWTLVSVFLYRWAESATNNCHNYTVGWGYEGLIHPGWSCQTLSTKTPSLKNLSSGYLNLFTSSNCTPSTLCFAVLDGVENNFLLSELTCIPPLHSLVVRSCNSRHQVKVLCCTELQIRCKPTCNMRRRDSSLLLTLQITQLQSMYRWQVMKKRKI